MSEPDRDALLDLYREHHDPPADIVSKLPKGREDKSKRAGCRICGGFHDPSMFHLDYVGHADVTRVLIETDPLWSWEPLAFTPEGLPAFDRDNGGNPVGLWIRLTVHGKTMLGYGSCEASKADGEKELIGDAIRNAAMRFGIALDLWSKAQAAGGDADGNRSAAPSRDGRPSAPQPVDLSQLDDAIERAQGLRIKGDYEGMREWASESQQNAEAAARKLRKTIAEHVVKDGDEDTQEGGQETTETDPEGDATDGGDGASGHDAGRNAPDPAPRDTNEGSPPADNGGQSEQEVGDATGPGKPAEASAGDSPSPAEATNPCPTCGPEPRAQPCPDCPTDEPELPWQRADRLGISAADQMIKIRELAAEHRATVPARRQYAVPGRCHPGLLEAYEAYLDEVEAGLSQPVGASHG